MKNFSKLASLMIASIFAFGLASCNEDSTPSETPPIEEHTHTFSSDWEHDDTHHWHEATCEHTDEVSEKAPHSWDSGTITTDATCESDGVMTYTCTICEATRTETIEALGHTYSEEWTYDETYHWHEATCEHTTLTTEKEKHFYEAAVCVDCGAKQSPTEGLVFNLINNDTEYELGQCSRDLENVLIPESHEGKPVTRIGNSAFYNSINLVSVTIPDSVTSIGVNAFYSCEILKSVTLGNGVTTIGKGAFMNCYKLTKITLPESLTTVHEWGFLDCVNLAEVRNLSSLPITAGSADYGYVARNAKHVYKEGESWLTYTDDDYVFAYADNKGYLCSYQGNKKDLVFPTSFIAYDGTLVTEYEMSRYLFYNDDAIKTVSIPGGATNIGRGAFRYCSELISVDIGDTITEIEEMAFQENDELTNITLGKNVTNIATDAFLGSVKILEIYNKSELPLTMGSTDYGRIAYYAKNIYTEEDGSWITVTEDGYRFIYDENEKKGYLFDYLGEETNLILPTSFIAYDGKEVTQYDIYRRTFYYMRKITSVKIPDGVTFIGTMAFCNCTGLTRIIIPKTLTYVEGAAFLGSNVKETFYEGTEEEYANIYFDTSNYEVEDESTKYFYSETKPTSSGNYWHYAEDGVTPEIWE